MCLLEELHLHVLALSIDKLVHEVLKRLVEVLFSEHGFSRMH